MPLDIHHIVDKRVEAKVIIEYRATPGGPILKASSWDIYLSPQIQKKILHSYDDVWIENHPQHFEQLD